MPIRATSAKRRKRAVDRRFPASYCLFGDLDLHPDRLLAMINELYGAATGTIPRSEVEMVALARKWIVWDWLRVMVIATGFVASIRAISVPYPRQEGRA